MEKLAIASYNNPNELHNQRSEYWMHADRKKSLATWQI